MIKIVNNAARPLKFKREVGVFTKEFFESRFNIQGAERLRDLAAVAPNNARVQKNPIGSKTTVFAIRFNGGVVIAGDRRMSDGRLGIISDSTIKVCQLSDFSAMASAGFCNVISYLERNMQSVCSSFEELYDQNLTPDGQANFLRNLLEPWWYLFMYTWYWVEGVPILATYDNDLQEPRIFCFDGSDFYYETENFGGTGCGYEAVSGVLRDWWRSDMNEGGAIVLAMRAMLHSGKASHGVSDSRLSLPTVATIDQNGFRRVSDANLKVLRRELLKITEGLR